MAKVLVICDADPYDGTDKIWHGIRVAKFAVDEGFEAKIFFISDGVYLAHESIPDTSGDLELDNLLRSALAMGVETAACGTCLAMRKLGDDKVKPGVKLGTMKMLTAWIGWADKVVDF